MYEQAGVSGPSEFARLPKPDRHFWNAWIAEAAERAAERNRSLEQQLDGV